MGKKQSGVDMQGREKAAGLGDGTVCGGEERTLKERAESNGN